MAWSLGAQPGCNGAILSDLKDFTGKSAIVTGATQGLGEMTARLLVERGLSHLIVPGRDEPRGAAITEDLRSSGCDAHFVGADLENPNACESVISEARKRFHKVLFPERFFLKKIFYFLLSEFMKLRGKTF